MVDMSAHLKLTFQWIALLNTLDLDGMASIMSENFTNQVRPMTMGFPQVGKQEYLERIRVLPLRYFNISLPAADKIVEDKNTVEFYTKADGKTAHGFPDRLEYVMTFKFEGDKLLKVDEFVDPTIVAETFMNEQIAAQADLNC